MFTGIIEGFGTISAIRPAGQGKKLTIRADFFLDDTKVGDSIAVNGACLTAVSINGKQFEADVSPETLDKTSIGRIRIGDRVNLERALRISDRIDGHLVSGHIDGIGSVKNKEVISNAVVVAISTSEDLLSSMIKKGSVAVDGVSLTINNINKDNFEVSIIPHTAKLTTIGFKKSGDVVNIETDMIGKYVERFISNRFDSDNQRKKGESSIDLKFLSETGFL